ncbi:MAG: hypothetical protein ACTSRP_00050 [Candidatus Helarchaeota archaeon]
MIREFDILKGIEFKKSLRFDLSLLKIKYNNEWRRIPKFNTGMTYKGIPIILEDVIFDTGNEAGYCQIVAAFYDLFKETFPQIKFIIKTRTLLISEEKIKFKFNDIITFKSFLGIKSGKVPINWINTINIGIDSITQFASMIYPLDINNSKCRFLCEKI